MGAFGARDHARIAATLRVICAAGRCWRRLASALPVFAMVAAR